MNGVPALKVVAVSHSEIKYCKKDCKKHTKDQSLLNLECCMLQCPGLALCPSHDMPKIKYGIGRD